MSVITDTASLTSFCERLSESQFVTVDTEFMREKTYWPQLCLVQLADENEAAAVDTLANEIDITPILNLMTKTNVLKVFHAARQDLEVFYRLMGKLPTPIFDTQIAAMVCGFGASVGYDTLVHKLTNKNVDKSSRFTDWARRPLTCRQIDYALADVTHLRFVYNKLNEALGQNGRRSWLNEELSDLTNTKNYTFLPEDAWQRVKSRSPTPRFLGLLKEIAAWREREAQTKDLPRNRILRDETLVEIAHHAPMTADELSRTRGFTEKKAKGPLGKALLNAIQNGLNVPEDKLPELKRGKPLPRGIGPVTDLLKVLLKMKSEEHNVAQKLIARVDELEKIAAFGEKAEVQALQGWRYQVFGKDALSLRAGRLALVINDQSLELVWLED